MSGHGAITSARTEGEAVTPYLVLLKNGPTYSLQDRIEYQLKLLSALHTGELWVTGTFEAHAQIGRFGVHVHKIEYPLGFLGNLRYALRVVARAFSLRRTHRGRCVVIAYDPFRNGLVGTVVAFLLGSPLIVEVNGCIGELEAYLDHRNSIAQAKAKRARLLRIGRWVLARANAVRLLYSGQLDGVFVPKAGTVIHQGFDSIEVDRFPKLSDEKTILFVGFPFYLKGVDVLMRAFLRITDEFPDWRLVLIGYGLVEEAAKITTHPRIDVRRPLPNWEIAEWIGRCGIFVLPSRSEAMGRVLLEAAAAGKPRIASRVGGTYTVVSDAKDGLLVAPNDPGALADALRKLVSDPALRSRYGEAARRRLETEFSDRAYLRNFGQLIDAVTRATGSSTRA